jgi:hypothetical protein
LPNQLPNGYSLPPLNAITEFGTASPTFSRTRLSMNQG